MKVTFIMETPVHRTMPLLLPFLLWGSACSDSGSDSATPSSGLPASADDAVATYVDIVVASYADTRAAAQQLDAAVDAFVAEPSQAGLDSARQAWLDSREPYLQTEVFRFYDGPIDDPVDGPEGMINAWPLDENYIDYVVGDEDTGLVNDDSVTLDAATLQALNEAGGEKNIATGYHALEFMLWGQDLSETGPGQRPWQDYLVGEEATAANGDRRALYLATVSELLVEHLSSVEAEWQPDAAWRADFEADVFTATERMLTGMIVLSGFETGGERIQAALDSGDQEDEHSCFSDNTHRDMIQDVQGVSNVWHGSTTRTDGSTVSGTGLRDVVAELDADLAARVDDRIAESLSLANALQPPFDQEIDPANDEGNARVAALAESLRLQEDVLFEVFTLLGMSVAVTE